MGTYRIAIEETVIDEFLVKANDEEEAIKIAIRKYDAGEFVLEPGTLITKQMAVVDCNSPTEWFEFFVITIWSAYVIKKCFRHLFDKKNRIANPTWTIQTI